MFTLLLILSITGAYLIVHTLKRSEVRRIAIVNQIERNVSLCKALGTFILLVPMVVFLFYFGATPALLLSSLYMMLSFMLVILLNPLVEIKLMPLLILAVVCIITEFIFTYAG